MSHYSVQRESTVEQIIKKSRFIGRCYPVKTEEEAIARIEELRKRFWDASHNCYAYAIGETGMYARFSDDGEPSGTAGLPMMEALKGAGVTDTLVVVTRYFGGTLLGTGGLVRAYGGCASAAIQAAGRVHYVDCVRLSTSVPYALWDRLEPLFRANAAVESVDYGADVSVGAWVALPACDALVDKITDSSDGRVLPQKGETALMPIPEASL